MHAPRSSSSAAGTRGSVYRSFTIWEFRARYSIHGHKPLSFLPTKNKLDAAGKEDGQINPSFRASWMYSSIALHPRMDNSTFGEFQSRQQINGFDSELPGLMGMGQMKAA